ncbi:MAG: glycine betaine ABC transporter substrate-binding protein [Pseudonocardia sp.]
MRPTRFLAVLAAAVLVLTACGGGGGSGGGAGGSGNSGDGSLAAIDLSGASFTVGSKEFTENILLGQIAVQALRATGADVADLATITGSTNVRTALTAGEIDLYWDYTGTGWTVYLRNEPSSAPKDSRELYEKVQAADAANGVAWLPPAPLNNTYALAGNADVVARTGVKTLSQYAELVNRDPNQARLCAAAEFLTRDDGFPGLERTYGFTLPRDALAEVELSLIAPQVRDGQTCTFGEVTSTDGAVAANDLVVLDDDKQFFVLYNAAVTVRQQVLDANPRLAEVFAPISAALTDDVVRELNERIDVGGELPDDVAEEFLTSNGFIA